MFQHRKLHRFRQRQSQHVQPQVELSCVFQFHENVRGDPFDVVSGHDDALDLREANVRQLGGHGRNGREAVECQNEDRKLLEGNYLVGKVGQVVVVEVENLEAFKFNFF